MKQNKYQRALDYIVSDLEIPDSCKEIYQRRINTLQELINKEEKLNKYDEGIKYLEDLWEKGGLEAIESLDDVSELCKKTKHIDELIGRYEYIKNKIIFDAWAKNQGNKVGEA